MLIAVCQRAIGQWVSMHLVGASFLSLCEHLVVAEGEHFYGQHEAACLMLSANVELNSECLSVRFSTLSNP